MKLSDLILELIKQEKNYSLAVKMGFEGDELRETYREEIMKIKAEIDKKIEPHFELAKTPWPVGMEENDNEENESLLEGDTEIPSRVIEAENSRNFPHK